VTYKLSLSLSQRHSRAKNAVAEFLFRQLTVPKVFIDAHWPNQSQRVDVMAVDRSGAGDVHVVEVKVETSDLRSAVATIIPIPGHFKYLALFENDNYMLSESSLYAPDGMGRVGVIQVKEDHLGDLSAEIRVRAERFKFEASFKQVDKFTAANPPYIEIRP
jgi:hypothetical protein